MQIPDEVFWTAFGAISTAVAALAAIFGSITVVLAIRQLRFDAWLKAQEIWTAREFTESRGHIFAHLDTHAAQEWTADEENEALQVCRKMDEFAGLISYLPKKTVLRVWGVPFAKAWLVLESVVHRERTKSKWSAKWQSFEDLGRKALYAYPDVRYDHSAQSVPPTSLQPEP